MIPAPFSSGLNPLVPPVLQPVQPVVSSFWQAENVFERLKKLQETIDLLHAMKKELEGTLLMRMSTKERAKTGASTSAGMSEAKCSSLSCEIDEQMLELIAAKKIDLNTHESFLLEAFRSLFLNLKSQLLPFVAIENQLTPWEEKSAAVRLAQKLQKYKRNKVWKKKKRMRVAEQMRENRENFFKVDRDADDWRAREIAKDAAVRKVESMKSIAKLKANEERKKLESELELILVVEKLQELRSIRIKKMKKQGHFLPEEDDKYIERVRASVEEEERQAAVAQKFTAKDNIPSPQKSAEAIQLNYADSKDGSHATVHEVEDGNHDKVETERSSGVVGCSNTEIDTGREDHSWEYDSVGNLPFEFYHYYHGSSNDMGTLIEVRQMWDAFIRSGGSRIPGHWVQPPAPADDVWASYLVGPRTD